MTDTPRFTRAEVEKEKRLHAMEMQGEWEYCGSCNDRWPCVTHRVLTAVLALHEKDYFVLMGMPVDSHATDTIAERILAVIPQDVAP